MATGSRGGGGGGGGRGGSGGGGGGGSSSASATLADATAPLPRIDYATYEPASLSAEYTQYEVGPGGALRTLPPTPTPPPASLVRILGPAMAAAFTHPAAAPPRPPLVGAGGGAGAAGGAPLVAAAAAAAAAATATACGGACTPVPPLHPRLAGPRTLLSWHVRARTRARRSFIATPPGPAPLLTAAAGASSPPAALLSPPPVCPLSFPPLPLPPFPLNGPLRRGHLASIVPLW